MFNITKKNESQRNGILKTMHGKVETPFFIPIATKGAVKTIEPHEIEKLGFEVILGNTYHLWMKPGDILIKENGGLHNFMNWNRAILTDSGGFQVFSLGHRAKARFGKSGIKLSREGVEFSDPKNGQKYFMSPEKSIEIQMNLGSDIIMCLDECPPFPCTYEYAQKSLELTTQWAKRCKEYFNNNLKKYGYSEKKRPLLFAIVQGSVYKDLRQKSTRDLLDIGFDGYAIGGVAVGEPREKLKKVLSWVIPILPKNKPRYLMGLGKPNEVVFAVKAGIDMFDCVIPTREGRHGRLFIQKKNSLKGKFYQTINISLEKYKKDFSPLDKNCQCPFCRNYSRSYLRHLLSISEPLGMKLASLHNLYFYKQLIEKLKSS